ncbi:MAG: RtcB family protein [Acidimicrobiia bacterium]
MPWHQVDIDVWEIEPREGMRAPGRIYASQELFDRAESDRASQQVMNVAHLPGIVEASMAMPDVHWGYGFPIGGVAATDVDSGGAVSPGGVGFDICCGVRLLASNYGLSDWEARGDLVMNELDRRIPRGLGKGAIADPALLDRVLVDGARSVVSAGYGWPRDLDRCEEGGQSAGADPSAISDKAKRRGGSQLGSLGAGNHFLEVQLVEQIIDPVAAQVFGLTEGMVCVMIHCGSRGLGHQTCTDQLQRMGGAMAAHGISVPDRQLACVPVDSREGQGYLTAMAAAANFAWANRHVLAHEARLAFATGFGTTPERTGMDLVYDVAHNLAKLENHQVNGRDRTLCVHRKGATRAFGAGHPDLPSDLRPSGQPILVPGSMGTASWVLKGLPTNPAFGSCAHGAGRVMSRKKARNHQTGTSVYDDLVSSGVTARPGSVSLLSEEAPYAYKDVDAVVEVCARTTLAEKVARLIPLGVVKG